MKFVETSVVGAWLIDVVPHRDDRGFFARLWCDQVFEQRGLTTSFVQCNTSYSHRRGTLRGLHYQSEPNGEVKLVRCIRGAIYDVIVDVRPQSPSYLKWFGIELTAESRRMLYVPAGCAHGFQTLDDHTEVVYPVSAAYAPAAERGVRWNDPSFSITWPDAPERRISPKDEAWPDFVVRPLVHD